MNLIYDIGNTSNKLAVYDRSVKVFSIRTKHVCCEDLQKMISPYTITQGIISSVKDLPEFIYDLISLNIPKVHILNNKTLLPFRNEYLTPETLGPDRIAAVAGAYYLYPGRNVLVIDAGSAVTYDFLSGKSYKGGNISPGLNMRFKALHKFTDKLPMGSAIEKFESPGRNTIEAISAGVIKGLVYEIDEYIRNFEDKNIDAVVLLTGGDGQYLRDRLSRKVNYQPDLVFDGLNHILEYNAKES
jgi:type III pantothenate kinase